MMTDHDELQSREAEELASRVQSILDDLRRVSEEPDFAYYASCALHGLHNAALPDRPLRISIVCRDYLIAVLKLAVPKMLTAFEPPMLRFAENGCNAVGRMIGYWAAPNELRTQVAPDRRADMIDQVRWLRNGLHNRSIVEQLDERAKRRREYVVRRLRSRAVAGSANQHGLPAVERKD